MELKICHLYPDVLNLYGDRGNILCMRRRLEWRGIACSVTELPLGVADDLTEYDLFFIGGGQDFEQTVLLSDLNAGRVECLRSAAEDGKAFLCICGGYQLLGTGYRTADGQMCEYTGILDLYTEGSADRMIGNYAFRYNWVLPSITFNRGSPLQKHLRHVQPRAGPAQEPGLL